MVSNRLVASLALLVIAGTSHSYPTAPPEVTAKCPFIPARYPLLLPNPFDCGSYICRWESEASVQYCPEDLHFNAVLQACDYPADADCAERTTAASASK
ncbi:peritrophin-1 [Penaeus vannamei]|uniref:peritrophin-1 n=1 Tax=Penaeus vannamei TaxID=6689 RepID=UPI00387F6643